jgi:L,D-peptidoglycan transpeptidase YkuD (ErfK/YbiS/YcfS/YnhG family)
LTRRLFASSGDRHVCRTLVVSALSMAATRGLLRIGTLSLPCALGRTGRRAIKREGDGATPIGVYAIRDVLYRQDRLMRPRTGFPARPIRRSDGWCDAQGDRNYNRPVHHPYPASAEAMWRDDHLYDLVVILGYNERPRIRGRGSAIFMHLAPRGYAPTAGCIAVSRRDLLLILARLRHPARLRVLT